MDPQDNQKKGRQAASPEELNQQQAGGQRPFDEQENDAVQPDTQGSKHATENADTHSGQKTGSSVSEDPGDDQMIDPEQEIIRLKEELDRTRESMLRKAAEFENLKRRTQKEKLQLFDQARADAVSRFLPIREDLKRSVEATEGKELEKGFVEGLRMVLANFERVLKDYGVEPIEEIGVPFDVDKHDAMLIQPAPDRSTESNSVLQVLEPGYRIGDRVIKHAKVIVSQ